MNLSKIRTSFRNKQSQSVAYKPKQPIFETPRKIKVVEDRQSTIDMTHKIEKQNCSDQKKIQTQSSRKFITVLQNADRKSPESKRQKTASVDSRKILKVKEIKERSAAKRNQEVSRSKSKKKICLTESTLRFMKSEVPKAVNSVKVVNSVNSDQIGYVSANELMAKKIKKSERRKERYETPIHLITEENAFKEKDQIVG